MNYISIICSLILITSSCHTLLGFKLKLPEFKNIGSFFKSYKAEKVIEQEYPLQKVDLLKIINTKGDISIPSEWEQPIVRVKATIKAAKEEELSQITISHAQHKNDFILSTHAPETCSHQVHYELIIPKKMNVELITDDGNMTITEASGKVKAETHKGNINIDHSKNSIMAQATHRGNITIHDAQGAVQIYSKKGNITVENARSSISAHTEHGIVRTAHNAIPNTSNINLGSEYGNIIVALPASTNANLKAKTEHGCITSEPYLTLKSQVTQLDPKSWSRFKKEVDATIGVPGQASINLTCKNGTIKLRDNSVTS